MQSGFIRSIFNELSIRNRIFLFVSTLVVSSLIITYIAVYILFYNTLTQQQIDSTVSSSKKNRQNIEMILKSVENSATQLGANSIIKEALFQLNHLTEEEKASLSDKMHTLFLNMLVAQSYINDIHLLSKDKFLFSSSINVPPEDMFSTYSHLFDEQSSYNQYHINTTYLADKNLNISTISLVRTIFDIDTGSVVGILIIDLNLQYIKEILTISSIQHYEKVILTTPDREIIFNYPNITDFASITNDNPEILTSKQTILFTKVFSKNSIIISDTINYTGWKIINIVSLEQIYSKITVLNNICITILILVIVFTIFSSLILSKTLTKPIKELIKKMSLVEQGNFNVKIDVARKDELGKLGNIFNSMVSRINLLIDKVAQESKEKSAMEFQVLQAQITPHFLYNTLDTIRWMAVIQNIDNISHMTSALINLLKYNISKKEIFVAFWEELESVKRYIEIQKYRYGDLFEIYYYIEDRVKEIKVLRFILQPIVENSIFHGFQSEDSYGIITISAYLKENKLYIEVCDNGVGISNNQNDEMLLNINPKNKFTGLGINNIDKRIKLYMGEEYGLKIESIYQKGTKVTIILPAN